MTAASSLPLPAQIRAPALRRAMISGVRRVIGQREQLNRINVFPVPDGDTGSNLAFTLGSVLSGALNRRCAHLGDLLRRVGDAAVDGARGNSGAILAQFFTGLAEAADAPRLGAAEFGEALRAAARSARSALAEPREGTILSVIAAFAEALPTTPVDTDLRAWFASGLGRARQALADTPRQLPVLAKAGVVDAGAQGFVDLLEGIDEFLASGRALRSDAAQDLPADLEAAEVHGDLGEADPEHRYCSECLLLGEGLDRAGLRAAVGMLGASCVVIAGSHSRLRLHAHVARPRELFDVAARFGRVESCKADDMLAQARSAASRGRVAVITDSAADLPAEVAERLNIHVVPVRVGFGEQDYLDKVGLSTTEFYQRLRREIVLPRTSQPPPGDFRRQFEFLLSHHPAVVYVGLSRAVSGTLQAAESAAQRGHAERIRVFDSANAAGGQALLAIAAAEFAATGASADAVLAHVEALRAHTSTWAMARDISHAVRGGRIPAWAKPAIEWSGLTPIAKVNREGRLSMAGALFGSRNAPERFARYLARRLPQGRWRLVVGHCDAEADGEVLRRALCARIDCVESWLVETGPAVGAHAGPGALVVAVQPAPVRAEVEGE